MPGRAYGLGVACCGRCSGVLVYSSSVSSVVHKYASAAFRRYILRPSDCTSLMEGRDIPLRLKLGKRLPLGVVTNDLDVDIAPQIELLGAEERVWLGHIGGVWVVVGMGANNCLLLTIDVVVVVLRLRHFGGLALAGFGMQFEGGEGDVRWTWRKNEKWTTTTPEITLYTCYLNFKSGRLST